MGETISSWSTVKSSFSRSDLIVDDYWEVGSGAVIPTSNGTTISKYSKI
jgi:hypothetical protein